MRELGRRIVAHWRLKLLSLVLAVGLLGAVAFSQNPIAYVTVNLKVEYRFPTANNLVLTSFPETVAVRALGLSSDINQYQRSAAGVTVDLTNAHAGANQTFYAYPKNVPAGVSVQRQQIPVVLTIEDQRTDTLDIEVRTPKIQNVTIVKSIATCGNGAQPCQVTVTSAASQLNGLHAYVNYDAAISTAGTYQTPSQKILFEQNGRPVDMAALRTQPEPSWTPSVVTVQIDAVGGTQSRQVPITFQTTGTQACGYSISRIDFSPGQLVTLHGSADQVAKIPSVSVGSLDITNLTTSQSYDRQISTGSAEVTSDPTRVHITVNVAPTLSCAAPTPTPKPSPT
jgi:YbbR domain-containing protein